ncbi:DEAD/DEAH box helicase [Porcipelethomonas sp.]|uniref:DEAD/DEAH box helicase n=1 Tax=Porcipelethomonas sp. TaxID=2981675 RepID=UPI003EFA364B
MDETKIMKLNLSMSPKAIDELKKFSTVKGVSKYELPLIMFPENQSFDISAAVNENRDILLNFNLEGNDITLLGSIEQNNFFCKSVINTKINGKRIKLIFKQEKNEDFTYVNNEVKQRFSMWYDYIESVRKKSLEKSFVFKCQNATVKNNKILILCPEPDCKADIRNLNIGIADEKKCPAWGFGKIDKFENEFLYVQPFGDINRVMSELSSMPYLIIYDGAADITCKRMKSGLDRLCAGDAVNKRLPEFLFDPSKANPERGDNITLSEEDLLTKTMNPEQISAVEGVLNAKDLYLIQGPPGTGKTTVIAEICYQNAVRGLKTLIVSQSNLAVDNAISRVMNHADIRVLRKGDASRVEEEGLPFVEDNVVRTWIGQIAEATEKMDQYLNKRISELKTAKDRLPNLLELAESLKESEKTKDYHESQLFFFKNVLDDAKKQRAEFFELITDAYENDDIEKAEQAREKYPPDFKLPNNIYNDITDKYLDIKADLEMVHEYESDLEFFNEYTSRFTEQFEYIFENVNRKIIERTAYEGVFYYSDREITQSLYEEGERIIEARPGGIKKLIFGYKWQQVLAIYYRRAENLMMSIQLKTIRLCEKIYSIRNNKNFIYNTESFHLCLDALGEDYDSQYYSFKGKYENVYNECMNAVRDYKYSVEYFKEQLQDDFYSKALRNSDVEKITLDEFENKVNTYYYNRNNRYVKWKNLLELWRKKISGGELNYNALKKLYIENANVIGITCIQSGTKDFSENYPSFDVVIIDEASKSTPPDIILPMLKGRKIVLVGDHKQLPPFIDQNAYDEIDEEDPNLKELIKVSLFEELYEKSDRSMHTMLFRQYRMHKDIAALINQFYIDTDAGRLESPASEYKIHHCEGGDITENNHVLWYDIPNKEKYYENVKNKSFYNVFEAESIKKILCHLEVNLKANNAHKNVGVITFYDAQVRLLEEKLQDSGYYKRFSHISLRIGSVDRFQGMEEDVIIISFVRNNQNNNIGFARDARRINVALSRAKELLIIVGSSDNFINSSNAEASGMFRNVFSVVSRLDGLRNAEKLQNIYLEESGQGEYEKTQFYQSAEYDEDYEDENSGSINILDYFILKAAYDFKGEKLSLKNISNVLGIAPVFVRNRIVYLVNEGMIECVHQFIRITPSGENMIKFLSGSNQGL